MNRMVSLGPDFPGVLGKIIEVTYHPKFSSQYDYDFCLLMIDRDIEYNEAVQPICMVDHEETMPRLGGHHIFDLDFEEHIPLKS